jgi:hypothetical protein
LGALFFGFLELSEYVIVAAVFSGCATCVGVGHS